jgi:23S rRNA pseudouridine1911/1915/1917 synthase
MPEIVAAEIKPVAIPLEVVFEDEHFIAINKQPGMVVHPGAGTAEDTMVHALLAHCAGQLSGVGGVERLGIVHRLDRETSGVIVAAKTDEAHRGLSAQFAERSLHKEYLALVTGKPELLSGVIDRPIGRNPTQRHKMAVVEDEKKGKHARTDWEIVETFEEVATLVRCTIHTGRTHQIRVHMKALGHIILGDIVYGWKPITAMKVQPERVMLHAEHLAIKHPISGEEMDLRAPIPDDFEAVLKGLRAVTRSKKR